MKILWISPFLPYDNVDHAGGKVLNYFINRFADDRNYEVRFVGLAWPKEYESFTLDRKLKCYVSFYHDHGIKKIMRNLVDLYSQRCPFDKNGNITAEYIRLCIMRSLRRLKMNGYEPDVIILHWTQTAVFVGDVKKIYPKAKTVGIDEDVSIQVVERKYGYASGLEKIVWKLRLKNVKKAEIAALNKCDLVIVNNEKDKGLLEKYGVTQPVKVRSVFYDRITLGGSRTDGESGQDVLFFGDMGRPENYRSAIWLLDEVYPLVEELGLRFVILGGRPPQELKDRATDRIIITGFVDDIVPYFEKSFCLAAPLVLGAGIKVKVLTCMAAGIPVLTNDIGIEGIPATDGKEYFHCKTKEEYAEAIKRLYEDPELAVKIGEAGMKLVDKTFSYERSFEEFKGWLKEL
ncbi:MAG: glycosyltransferase family 4 protein [Butyrivibrio sp.]|nr:glycosyltransferase family 4 protein [Butyrivibrio sp.]